MLNPIEIIGVGLRKVFGTRNDRLIKSYTRVAEQITALEPQVRGDFDARFAAATPRDFPADITPEDRAAALQRLRVELSEDLVSRANALAQRLLGGAAVAEVLPEAFALVREASRRAQNHRHFDCQCVGGQVLYEGKVAEMKTGEGKTIVCHLAAFMKCLQGKKVHIVTVNDYLVQRDAGFAKPIFELLGLSVGFIQSQVDPGGHEGVRQHAYACNITYGTNNEFGFDYLRDNMKVQREAQVQGRLDFAVIDEVDSILIDEARTPLIISGPAEDNIDRYRIANQVAQTLMQRQSRANSETMTRIHEWGEEVPAEFRKHPKFEDAFKKFKTDQLWINEDEAEALGHTQYYVVARERKSVHLTHEGITVAQEQLGVGSLYVGQNMEWPHAIENAVRANVVYEQDVEYVVKDGEVIIVDEFTGRLMYGRQWSDGLHQAVEAKAGVRIKEESQTLATITLQNFFKLYERISGMTGTAMTEADEFMKIYKLDVVGIPTNRPVNRRDHNDRIYKTVEDKYKWIVEEIHDIHQRGRPNDPMMLEAALKGLRNIHRGDAAIVGKIDAAIARFDGGNGNDELMGEAYDDAMGDLGKGRPILVGTTSIENSEKLSNLLTNTYGIEHEVLNAKQHAREADIVAKAGHRTMPVRGEKRMVGNVTIATNMAGRGTDIKLEQGVVHKGCQGDLGYTPEQRAMMKIRKPAWHEHGVHGTKCCVHCTDYDPKTNCAHCWKPQLDPRFPEMGRRVCPITVPCGLHIVGTERHESRRIDNQLRGRAGRQGDPGSSQFFLSISDELMKMFMGDRMLWLLEKMGFEEGMSIEARSVNKAIERAQRKVEERNFGIRKHLLEYDEVMDHQRQVFYQQRQAILELRGLRELIWKMIEDAVADAVRKFLDPLYRAHCVVAWVRDQLECTVNVKKLDVEQFEILERQIRENTREEMHNQITNTLGEYMDPEVDASTWDYKGLQQWAEKHFDSPVTQNALKKMSQEEVRTLLMEAADKKIDATDLTPLSQFMSEDHGRVALLAWARQKFAIEIKDEDVPAADLANAGTAVLARIRESYRQRELQFPVQRALNRFGPGIESGDVYSADALAQWSNAKFNVGWTADSVRGRPVSEVAEQLRHLQRDFMQNGKLDAEIDQVLRGESDIAGWAARRFGPLFNGAEFDAACNDGGPTGPAARAVLLRAGQALIRLEMTRLEQEVLLRTYDGAWKEHMHAMDLLKEAIGLRQYAEQDPKIAYKREGFRMFNEMLGNVRERVTSEIMQAQDLDERGPRAFRVSNTSHADSANMGFSGASVAADRAAAMRGQQDGKKVEPIKRDQPRVGRNEQCHCGSGKKFKNCHGRKTAGPMN